MKKTKISYAANKQQQRNLDLLIVVVLTTVFTLVFVSVNSRLKLNTFDKNIEYSDKQTICI